MEPGIAQPSAVMILPFVVLLVTIALAPLIAPLWWLKHYPKVALSLGVLTLSYYLFGLRAHAAVLHTAHEYLSFVTLIGSLFVVAGGIHITVKGEATPLVNCVFLAIGAIIANVLGTTGASMLLIRPWIRMNKYRITAHHIVFFIFIVSNVGGCLTPIGDPPLFLGYLKGIPFWWVAEHCWPMWLVALGVLLGFFFVIDYRNYLRAPSEVRSALAAPQDHWRFQGLGILIFLAVVLVAVSITAPAFVREALVLAEALGSYFTPARHVDESNHFDLHPIREVAILFIGIFATMMPALDWLQLHADTIGSPSPTLFYWSSGILSSVLDNAPTYLSFLKILFGAFVDQETIRQVHQLVQGGGDFATAASPVRDTFLALQKYHPTELQHHAVGTDEIEVAYILGHLAFNQYLLAISIGAVFFGANTYIGNGPNFMVKSIADDQKVHTPSFLGYILKYSLPCMGSMVLIVWWIFFRR